MKKIFSLFLVVICFSLLNSCCFGCDYYYGKRPFDYGAAKWVSENPSAYFVITDDDNPHENIKGEIKVDEETFEIEVFFMYQSVALSEAIVPSFENKYRVRELYGDCKYSPEKLIIKVDKEQDTIFNGKYEELVFVRETNTGDSSLC